MSEAKPSPSKRSARPKKAVDYAALHDVKVDGDDGDDVELVTIKRKRKKDSSSEAEIVTDGKCGQCAGCKRRPCHECSHCKNGDAVNCIDLYCMNQKEGRSQREAAREAYLLSLGKARLNPHSSEEDVDSPSPPPSIKKQTKAERLLEKQEKELAIQQQVDLIMEQIGAAQRHRRSPNDSTEVFVKVKTEKPKAAKTSSGSESGSPAKKSRPSGGGGDPLKTSSSRTGIYGGSSKAAKSRRCGECEGCMRDDCGQCAACEDKPRFGGRGTKKKACVMRYCRMRKLEEDHAQANFPLNSADALKGPRPTAGLSLNRSVGVVKDEEESTKE